MQDDEIPNARVLEIRALVEMIDVGLAEFARREVPQQSLNRRLNQMNAGGFQRLEKTAGETHSDAVLVPDLLALAGRELDVARIGARLAVEISLQHRRRFVIADERAGIHVPVASAMLKRNAPLPA